MRDVPGTKKERTRRSLYRLLTDLERQLSFENPESLVLVVVHVEWCLLTIRFEHLDERVAPVRLFARSLYGGQQVYCSRAIYHFLLCDT
jgi:hypothetical protein